MMQWLRVGAGVGVLLVACVEEPEPAPPAEFEDRALLDLIDQGRAAPVWFRSIDGRGNNRKRPQLGSAGEPLLRLTPVGYGDGVSTPAGDDRPSARSVSNAVCAQSRSRPGEAGASDYLWQWGQLLDHDIDLTGAADPAEAFPIAIPIGDPHFDPAGEGGRVLDFERSLHTLRSGVRQQLNEITAYIDASFVYGSDAERASALRAHDGRGRLATGDGDLLPRNTFGLPNAAPSGADPEAFFLAGDVRANEQVGLTAMHTLFVREHNRVADRLHALAPWMPGDLIYQLARSVVAAEVQAITYNEFLPLLLGPGALPDYRGYRPGVDAGIANEFSTAGYRLGHSMLSPQILRLDAGGGEIAHGHLPLRDAFFDPDAIRDQGGIDPILRGLAGQASQAIDVYVVDDVRNFLFGAPGSGGFDLASLNIQRGRDHGLASYNDARAAYGLAPRASIAEVSSDPEVRRRLEAAYDDVADVDLWIGALAEDRVPGALVGELLRAILVDQFTRLRDGDRFFYRGAMPGLAVAYFDGLRLGDIIRRNTGIGDELPRDVFVAGAVQ